MKREVVETDVLCVGGGIAGLMAGIRASERGARVVVAEKGNSLRSGAGATGNDHFMCYMPESHGTDIKPIIAEVQHSLLGKTRDVGFVRAWLEQSLDIVNLWDSWGIPMKYAGRYEFAGHGFPGRPLIWLKYAGENQKLILTKEARRRGAKVMNRTSVFDLLGDDSIVGAVGVDTREDKIVEFRTKSVVLGTGGCMRLYPGPTPGWMANLSFPFGVTGTGRALAYRVGAELVNLEILHQQAGPKYFVRSGKGTWVGVLRDPHGKPVGPFVTEPSRKYGDVAADVYQTVFEDYAKSGKGPVYMDCGGISESDYEYMTYWLKQEGNTAMINHLEEEGIDPRIHPVEFMTYGMSHPGGVFYNDRAETSLKGLYAAGDEFCLSGISCAAIFGWIAGENAASYSKDVQIPDKRLEAIDERTGLLDALRGREVGPDWKEVNITLQQIMQDYAGAIRSETLLTAGLSHLQRLKEKARATMLARNQHELARCLEVLDLLDLGELVFIAANDRKETRGKHVRADYPFANPLMEEKLHVVRRVGEGSVTEWRDIIH